MSAEIVVYPIPTYKEFNNLTDQEFDRWTVDSFAGFHGQSKPFPYWNCICKCGVRRVVKAATLINHTSRSCGCIQATHRESKTPIYHIWNAMHRRCECPQDAGYRIYGERGISVDPRWDDFIEFRNWALSHGYGKGLEIDRIDVDGNYCPENCRFVTRSVNMHNCRKRPTKSEKHSKYIGVSFDKVNNKWRASGTANGRVTNLGRYFTEAEAALARDQFYDLHFPNQFTRNFPIPEITSQSIPVPSPCPPESC